MTKQKIYKLWNERCIEKYGFPVRYPYQAYTDVCYRLWLGILRKEGRI